MDTRKQAYEILCRVEKDNAYAGLLLRHVQADSREMAQITAMVYETLRNQYLLEAQWHPYIQHKVRRETAVLLNLGVCQLFFMDGVPAYAAINSTVSLAGRKERGFVNAVLRKVQQAGLQMLPDDFEHAGIRYSHPQWLLQMWKAHYGKDKALEIAKADQQPSHVYGRINTLKQGEDLRLDPRCHFVNDLSFTADFPLASDPMLSEGKYVIQDVHSAMVPLLLDVKPGMKVLDVCAAPGTKTQETAMLMENKGEITACDLYPARCELIDQLMQRTGVSIVKTCVHDGRKEWENNPRFDRILLDAPCSGLGDLSHKPEIRYRVSPQSLDEIVRTQKEILDAIAPLLAECGILVYSTCTLNRKENEAQIHAFLQRHPEYQLLKEKTWFPTDGDGFYAAQLIREEKQKRS
ncbi:MAG: 16S rRNA (cytosine(967)-C(5))-methyltransferase RsmB [Lactimicrobium sp.]|jgi:16S rRNA (cytosine967-C5)-methyltransferase|uniref:16S rRNA (cytosine(967)-C(5))-methyltransferase RsmB n=1 Tax=Lactimicrobium sp. TaxID=2563780 RepID=UPI002F3580D1